MRESRLQKIVWILVLVVLTYVILHFLKFYLLPVLFASLFAMLMLPLSRKLERWSVPRIFSSLICLLIVIGVFVLVVMLISSQVAAFANDLPAYEVQLNHKFELLQQWIASVTGYDTKEQMVLLNNELDNLLRMAGGMTTGVLLATGTTIVQTTLMMIHFILFLIYRGRIRQFFLKILPPEQHERANHVIEEISKVTQRYLAGVLIVMAVIAVLDSVGLLAIGLTHVFFLGVLAAVINVIPYVGAWLGCALCMLLALVTKDEGWYIIAIFLIFLITHFLDSNILTPRITGSQIKVNPMATLAAIIFGEMTWGIPGMILFIPLLGIAKIVFLNVEELKPVAYLIGDESDPKDSRFLKLLHKVRKKMS